MLNALPHDLDMIGIVLIPFIFYCHEKFVFVPSNANNVVGLVEINFLLQRLIFCCLVVVFYLCAGD